MILEAYGKSDIGLKRRRNEDSFWLDKNIGAAIVSDGMGGHAAGGLASSITVECFRRVIGRGLPGAKSLPEVEELLTDSLKAANRELLEAARKDPQKTGMGATAVAACLWRDSFVLINIGDSRAYLVRNGKISQVTKDHTLMERLVKEGVISPEEARVHPQRNLITRAIGRENGIKADLFSVGIEPDDLLILCTDGLSKAISNAELLETLRKSASLEKACSSLIDRILAAGAPDNVTVVLLQPVFADMPG